MNQNLQTNANTAVLERADASDPILRLVQVTDCHILASPDQQLRGMDTRLSFEAVCEAIRKEPQVPDLWLATGDLSQDESAGAYRYLAGVFDQLDLPVFWLPGNHDDPELMNQHLNTGRVSPAKRIEANGWLIVLLDSTLRGETEGELSATQLDFLRESLRESQAEHALICQHHQALPAGSEWIDRLGLKSPTQLVDALRGEDKVRAVLWGHVHQQLDLTRDNITWMSTPSTCMQFKPGSRDFALDDQPPGYRWIELHADGRVKTRVERLEGTQFVPGGNES